MATAREKIFAAFLLILTSIGTAFGAGSAPATVLTNLHWVVTSFPQTANCSQLTDIYLDISGALSTSYRYSAYGNAACNTPSGSMSLALTGNILYLSAGFGVSLYMEDGRIVCTLNTSTLSSTACALYQISTGSQVGTFAMTYVAY